MKNKKIINGICYVITAALAVFYLATLVLGQKREVSKEYDLYYVDDELSRWPGEHGLDYSFGDVDIYDTSKLDEYKRLLEEEKLYGDPSYRDESDEADDKESDKDKVESNRDSAIDKYFQKMLAAQSSYSQDNAADKAGDTDTDTDSSEKTVDLHIPYRYSKGFYSLHTGIYTTDSKEASLYYRFTVNVPSDVVLDVYGASYNTTTKVYANDTYIGTIEAYDEAEEAVTYHKNEYGDRIRVDKVNDNRNVLIIPVSAIGEDGLVKLTFVPGETVSIYNYMNSIGNDNFKKYKGFRITSIEMRY